jgi:hypothetical protein
MFRSYEGPSGFSSKFGCSSGSGGSFGGGRGGFDTGGFLGGFTSRVVPCVEGKCFFHACSGRGTRFFIGLGIYLGISCPRPPPYLLLNTWCDITKYIGAKSIRIWLPNFDLTTT